jgi:hypothetical protein
MWPPSHERLDETTDQVETVARRCPLITRVQAILFALDGCFTFMVPCTCAVVAQPLDVKISMAELSSGHLDVTNGSE